MHFWFLWWKFLWHVVLLQVMMCCFVFEMSVCVVSVCFKVPPHLHSIFSEQQVWLGRFRIPSLAGLAKTCQRRTLRWLVSQRMPSTSNRSTAKWIKQTSKNNLFLRSSKDMIFHCLYMSYQSSVWSPTTFVWQGQVKTKQVWQVLVAKTCQRCMFRCWHLRYKFMNNANEKDL